MESLELDTKLARCYQVHLRLMSQCAGLLEVRSGHQSWTTEKELKGEDMMRPEVNWSFSIKHQYMNAAVHYLHRTTRDFLKITETKYLMASRLVNQSFDSFSWLSVHQFVVAFEVLRRVHEMDAGSWGMFGHELREKTDLLLLYLSKCKNKKIRDGLTHLGQCADAYFNVEGAPRQGAIETANKPGKDEHTLAASQDERILAMSYDEFSALIEAKLEIALETIDSI